MTATTNGVGGKIRDLRTGLGLTQTELEERVRAHGGSVPQTVISRIERGEYKEVPAPDLLNPLAGALSVPVEVLLAAAGYAVGTPPAEANEQEAALCRLVRQLPTLGPRERGVLEQTIQIYIRYATVPQTG